MKKPCSLAKLQGCKSVIGITTAMCYDKVMVIVIPHYGRYVKLPNLNEGGLHNKRKSLPIKWGKIFPQSCWFRYNQ